MAVQPGDDAVAVVLAGAAVDASLEEELHESSQSADAIHVPAPVRDDSRFASKQTPQKAPASPDVSVERGRHIEDEPFVKLSAEEARSRASRRCGC